MSATPRTDAEAFWISQGEDRKQYQGCEYVRAAVARTLEKGLAEAKAALGEAEQDANRYRWLRESWLDKDKVQISSVRIYGEEMAYEELDNEIDEAMTIVAAIAARALLTI